MIKTHKSNKSTLIILGWLMLFTLQASAQTDSAKEVKINIKPWQDFSESIITKWEANEIDLSKSFSVELVGTINNDGRFDLEKTRFTKAVGDEDIVTVAKSAIEVVGKNGSLGHLRNLGIREITLNLSQDIESFSAIITSNVKSVNDAKTLASAFTALFSIAKLQKKVTEDDKLILNGIKKPISESSQLILQFEMAKSIFQEIINRNLKEASEKRQK